MSATIDIRVSANETNAKDFGTATWAHTISYSLPFAATTDLVFFDERTVASATADDIDLAGSLVTPLGTAFTPADITAIVLINQAKNGTANTTTLTVGGDANGFEGFVSSSGTIGPVPANGMLIIAGDDLGAVTAGTGDILQITNSSGAANTYQIAIFGKST